MSRQVYNVCLRSQYVTLIFLLKITIICNLQIVIGHALWITKDQSNIIFIEHIYVILLKLRTKYKIKQ